MVILIYASRNAQQLSFGFSIKAARQLVIILFLPQLIQMD